MMKFCKQIINLFNIVYYIVYKPTLILSYTLYVLFLIFFARKRFIASCSRIPTYVTANCQKYSNLNGVSLFDLLENRLLARIPYIISGNTGNGIRHIMIKYRY